MDEINNEELQHHGILGMKWGVRRYQNADGSLTAAGRKRVAKMKDEYTSLTGKRLIRKPTKKSNVETANKETSKEKKRIKDMTDDELRNKINRLQMEKQAKGLETELSSNGQKFVRSVGKDVIGPAAIAAGKNVLTNWFTKVGSDMLGLNKTEKDTLSNLRKEVEELELKKKKSVAEDYFNKKKEKKKTDSNNSSSNDTETSKNKKETVDAEFVYDSPFSKKETTSKSSSSKTKDIFDADWSEVNVYSNEIVPYRNKGEVTVRRLFGK